MYRIIWTVNLHKIRHFKWIIKQVYKCCKQITLSTKITITILTICITFARGRHIVVSYDISTIN